MSELLVSRFEFENLRSGQQKALLIARELVPAEVPGPIELVCDDDQTMKQAMMVTNASGSASGLPDGLVLVSMQPPGMNIVIAPGMPWVVAFFSGGQPEYRTSEDIQPFQMGILGTLFDQIARWHITQGMNAAARRDRPLITPGLAVAGRA